MKLTVEILQEWYNEFNKSMFNGLLLPVTIKVTKHKRALGTVGTIRGSGVVSFLNISNLLNRTEQCYKDTLAHEMIHVFQVQNKLPLKHDKFFFSECERINKSFPEFNLSETLNFDELKVNPGKTNKVVVAVKIGTYATFMTEKAYERVGEAFKRRVLSMFNHFTQEEINNCKVSYIPLSHAQMYTIHRATRTLNYNKINEKLSEIIEKEGKLLLK